MYMKKKSRGVLGAIFLTGLVSFSTLAHSKGFGRDAVSNWGDFSSGGEGHVPIPFDAESVKFELADGELYALVGRVIVIPAVSSVSNDNKVIRAYFEICFDKYPWLANSKRRKFPLYPILIPKEGSDEWIHQFVKLGNSNEAARLYFKAHGRIVKSKGESQYVISLEPLLLEK